MCMCTRSCAYVSARSCVWMTNSTINNNDNDKNDNNNNDNNNMFDKHNSKMFFAVAAGPRRSGAPASQKSASDCTPNWDQAMASGSAPGSWHLYVYIYIYIYIYVCVCAATRLPFSELLNGYEGSMARTQSVARERDYNPRGDIIPGVKGCLRGVPGLVRPVHGSPRGPNQSREGNNEVYGGHGEEILRMS